MDDRPGPGRRSNGLPSSEWGALVDLDPRLSEALLASLAAEDVPAFVEPAGDQSAWSRASQLPARPLDRLWIAPDRADAARVVVAREVADLTALLAEQEPGATAHGFVQPVPRSAGARVLNPPTLPEPPAEEQPSDDEAWRRIVEGFHRDADGPVPPWPVIEDVAPSRGKVRGRRPEPATDDHADPPTDSDSDADGDSDAGLPDWVEPEALDDDGHYVPPPPPPVPRLSPRKLAAAITVVAGFLLMFGPGLLRQPRTAGVVAFGAVLTIGGAAALIWLMRDAPANGGPDDGAVV